MVGGNGDTGFFFSSYSMELPFFSVDRFCCFGMYSLSGKRVYDFAVDYFNVSGTIQTVSDSKPFPKSISGQHLIEIEYVPVIIIANNMA